MKVQICTRKISELEWNVIYNNKQIGYMLFVDKESISVYAKNNSRPRICLKNNSLDVFLLK
jgi:hypothetical protein